MTAITCQTCPCGSGQTFSRCCGPHISGAARPATAEALMRSRYCAYTLGEEAYLLATWHSLTRPANLDFEGTPMPKWLGLAVKGSGQEDENHAWVEFVARYKIAGRAFRLHEISRFERLDGIWFYLDGEVTDSPGPQGSR